MKISVSISGRHLTVCVTHDAVRREVGTRWPVRASGPRAIGPVPRPDDGGGHQNNHHGKSERWRSSLLKKEESHVDQINPYPGQTEHCLFFILGVSLPLSLLIKPTAKTMSR
jgi:hypothetical protein